ncbi:FG-GAP-like repeat-containing protein [Streptomyces sp. SID12501]|uniref:VCBS repeat-containing protein n=1 Tax=Streptomyces sp. SID12501 TaxID=2706042 RepID=A0A6B3BUA8_9ACTN|nr:FG-GAP-like repeat-containing protein [Streptomyces sp. SID12501]NEC87954.1 VCBS repeat-containing protein [Streptomyces sp. SID12501]
MALVAAVAATALGLALLESGFGFGTPGSGPEKPAAKVRPVDEDTAQDKARATGTKVEVTALRDESSTTYANPDGTFTLTTHAQPIRARNADGQWQDIDTSLVATEQGWTTTASPTPVTFSSGGPGNSGDTGGAVKSGLRQAGYASARQATYSGPQQAAYTAAGDDNESGTGSTEEDPATPTIPSTWSDLVTLTTGGHDLTVSWPGALPEPVITDAQALYRDVLPDVDLLLTARDTGFSHVLIVHTPEAAAAEALTELTYRLTSPDLTFQIDPATDTVTAHTSDGTEVAVSPTPLMWDSAGTPDVTIGDDPEPTDENTGSPEADPSASASEESDEETITESENDEAVTPEETNPDNGSTSATASPDTSTGDDTETGSETASAEPASFTRAAPAGLSTTDTLALQGLAGPVPGTHAATAQALLTDGAYLTVRADTKLLTAAGTTYPVFIDPSVSGVTDAWTTAYKRYPSSSFFDGANYNTGTTEARVGYESDTWGTARSFFRLKLNKKIKGATVRSATVKVRETHSWSCSARQVELWHTGGISSSTTWNNQPSWKDLITEKSFAHGWKSSSCPDADVDFNIKSLAQSAADGGWTSFTIGLRANSASGSGAETDPYTWKKFSAEGDHAPDLSITYLRAPNTPTNLAITAGTCDTSASPYINIGKQTTITLSAKATDPDGDLASLYFEYWRTGYSSTTKVTATKPAATATGAASWAIAGTKFTNGYDYSWRVRAEDDDGTDSGWAPTTGDDVCRFTYNTSIPTTPGAVSTVFPEDLKPDGSSGNGSVWSTETFGTTGAFTFTTTDTDVVKYAYSFNATTYANYVCASSSGTTGGPTASCSTVITSKTVTGKPTLAGPNVLYIKAYDAAGNASNAKKYVFYVTPKAVPDGAADYTGDQIPDFAAIRSTGKLYIESISNTGTYVASTPTTHDEGTLLTDATSIGHWWNGTSTYALITHNGDFAPGDGITDFVVRTPDGGLYLYPGDGYGGTDVSQRQEIQLPSNAPDPATLTDIKSMGDANGDEQPELLAISGDALWIFSGYSGGSFATATQLSASSWSGRDLVTLADFNSDDTIDLLYRTAAGNLWLRHSAASTTGTDWTTLASSAASLDGDSAYATGGFLTTTYPYLYGSPGMTSTDLPDIWAITPAGLLYRLDGTATGISATTYTGKTLTVGAIG